MVIITIANQKGGVGKTTTAVTLAHGLAQHGPTVLLIDLDPQGQCASLLGMEQEPGVFDLLVNRRLLGEVVRPTGRPRLWLLPGNKRTETVQIVLGAEGRRKDVLQELARQFSPALHYVVLDTAPAVGILQANALWAADWLLIPTATDYLGLEGVAEILNTLEALERPEPPAIRILPTFYDEVTTESARNLANLRRSFPQTCYPPIHRATILRVCAAMGRTVFEIDAVSRAAIEYRALTVKVRNGQ